MQGAEGRPGAQVSPGATMAPPVPITETFDRVLKSDPGRTALVGPSRTLSYEELDRESDAAAAALGQAGVSPGDRVAVSLPNDVDIVVAFHGAMRLGAVWVGINRALAPPEKEELLAACRPSLVLADPDTAAAHEAWPVLPVSPEGPGWREAVASHAGAPRMPAPDQDRPAGIAFTSGTTGLPKGIVHSQRNLMLPAMALVATRGYDHSLRKGDCLPLTILNLQVLTTLLTSTAGGCCVLTDRRDARGVAEWIGRESVNVWNGVPALLYSMLHDPELDPALLSGLREVWTGGAACPEDLFGDFRSRFGVSLHQSYGLTEAPTVVTFEPVGGDRVEGSSGVPLPQLEVLIRDEAGRDLPAGETGEVVVRGARTGPWAGLYRPMLGLWKDDSVEPFDGEELPTGDLGFLDAGGNLHIRDRKKLMILRGGANVYPAEVERVIDQFPGVRASAVLGLPDPRLGQRVVAALELDPGATVTGDAVVEHCRQRLARYKVPEQVVVVGSLPRNAMGKVQRAPLAEMF